MRLTRTLLLVPLAAVGIAMPCTTAVAAKPPVGSSIRVEDLGKPNGSVMSAAGAISDSGKMAVRAPSSALTMPRLSFRLRL